MPRGSGPIVLQETVPLGETVRGLLRRLVQRHPSMLGTAVDPETGTPRPHLVLLVDGLRASTGEQYDAPLRKGAEIVFLPAYAGGAGPPVRPAEEPSR